MMETVGEYCISSCEIQYGFHAHCFSRRHTKDTLHSSSLTLAVIGLLMPALFVLTTGQHGFVQREVVSGVVTFIDFTDGYFRLNGNPGDPTTGLMVRLDDPTGRHTVQQGLGCASTAFNCSPDPRFTEDPDNYTQSFSTGSRPTERRSRPGGTRSPSQRALASRRECTPPRLVAFVIRRRDVST